MKHLLLAGVLVGLVEIGGATRNDPPSYRPEAITIHGARVIHIEPLEPTQPMPDQNWGDRPFTKDMKGRNGSVARSS